MSSKIVQLIPTGPGWRVRYERDGHVVVHRLAAWALVEHDDGDGQPPYQTVDGVDPNGRANTCLDDEGFIDYLEPSEGE